MAWRSAGSRLRRLRYRACLGFIYPWFDNRLESHNKFCNSLGDELRNTHSHLIYKGRVSHKRYHRFPGLVLSWQRLTSALILRAFFSIASSTIKGIRLLNVCVEPKNSIGLGVIPATRYEFLYKLGFPSSLLSSSPLPSSYFPLI